MIYKVSIIVCLFFTQFSFAHEGLWLPFLQEQNIFPAMQNAGCKLTPSDIYDVNNASLKDAIVKIGNGCSGGIISEKGLVITNHHCVEYFIQQASSVSQNYLYQGFWAESFEQEIPAYGLHVSVLHEIIDVTDDVLFGFSDTMSAHEYQIFITAKTDSIIAAFKLRDSILNYSIESFYGGNQYILFSSYRYTDVRFVGFMPVGVASFGSDLDNWMWPRHAADFALIRIYADSLCLPSGFSESNVPYIPQKHISIDTSGVSEGDFTMLMGYPAQTNNYATSYEVSRIFSELNPLQIELRKRRLEPMHEYMNLGEEQSFQYHATYYRLLNYYVKWQGEQEGIERSEAILHKRNFEKQMQAWVLAHDSLSEKYNNTLSLYDSAYANYFDIYLALMTYVESVWKMDFFDFAEKLLPLYYAARNNDVDLIRVAKAVQISQNYFSKKAPQIEEKSVPQVMSYLDSNLNASFLPDMYRSFSIPQRNEFIQSMVHESILFQEKNMNAFLKKISKKRVLSSPQKIVKIMEQDKGIQFVIHTRALLRDTLFPQYYANRLELDYYTKKYMQLRLAYSQQHPLSPEANGTLRISFGNVHGYSNADAVYYASQTTSHGLQQKWSLDNSAYQKDEILDSLFTQNQFGSFYTDTVFVNFIGTNHTTGGNSGSPVLNAYGNLIGLNFDKSRAGTMSDLFFDISICRNIMVDVRYILFCIEMYANAPHIIQEMSFY